MRPSPFAGLGTEHYLKLLFCGVRLWNHMWVLSCLQGNGRALSECILLWGTGRTSGTAHGFDSVCWPCGRAFAAVTCPHSVALRGFGSCLALHGIRVPTNVCRGIQCRAFWAQGAMLIYRRVLTYCTNLAGPRTCGCVVWGSVLCLWAQGTIPMCFMCVCVVHDVICV
jgi:hypothetical protein